MADMNRYGVVRTAAEERQACREERRNVPVIPASVKAVKAEQVRHHAVLAAKSYSNLSLASLLAGLA